MNKVQELEIDTKCYWETSLTFNRRRDSSLTVETALKNMHRILLRTQSSRKLACCSNKLLYNIIGNAEKPKNTKKKCKNKSVTVPIKINDRIN